MNHSVAEDLQNNWFFSRVCVRPDKDSVSCSCRKPFPEMTLCYYKHFLCYSQMVPNDEALQELLLERSPCRACLSARDSRRR